MVNVSGNNGSVLCDYPADACSNQAQVYVVIVTHIILWVRGCTTSIHGKWTFLFAPVIVEWGDIQSNDHHIIFEYADVTNRHIDSLFTRVMKAHVNCHGRN